MLAILRPIEQVAMGEKGLRRCSQDRLHVPEGQKAGQVRVLSSEHRQVELLLAGDLAELV